MSADPLGGLLGGSVQQHAIQDDMAPVVEHHQSIAQHDAMPALGRPAQRDADFWISPDFGVSLETRLGEIEQTLASAHDQTGLTNVRNDYGFRGSGQTVAVIDSGIAYDHYALGGGFGANYRVVGGYDFTESGAGALDPYDDGPYGSHGTHVSGIVGGDAELNTGVAPDADLVGLRVFNDNGDGYFSWVEQALSWVHANRNSFENPITAVNLSLGTEWNSDSVPSWSMLEDEFAQLEADGIFISVSAGNSYTNFNEPGLSYPAASPYVVPVMSTDDSGMLSYFSQRHQRAIAAPGRSIVSTVPDYAGNNNGIADDYANFSGTSMAAPYVAGASVILREAMEFVGYENIVQDTIFDHIMATADQVFDSATGLTYDRLNLDAAIDALMPVDDYGSTADMAYGLGTLEEDGSLSGVISTLADADYFTFTAGITGTVSFTADTTHRLAAAWSGPGAVSGENGETFTLDVVQGQSYTLGLATDDGLGYYDLAIDAESSFTYTDWGTVDFNQYNVTGTGDAWFYIVAGKSGYLTAEAFFADAAGDIDLALYDTDMQMLSQSASVGDGERVDFLTSAGDGFYLRVMGANDDIDFQLTNLVSVDGSTFNVTGTAGDDTFSFAAGTTHAVAINGVNYEFSSADIDTIYFDGGAGNDTISLTGTSGNETATLRVGDVSLVGASFTATAINVENVSVDAGGGDDTANLYDSAGDDTYTAYSDRVLLSGSGFSHEATGFDRTFTYASTGNDQATFHDTAGNDTFAAWSNRAVMLGTGYFNDARGFDTTLAIATTGIDRANFHDTAGDDTYRAYSDRAIMTGAGYSNEGRGFDATYAFASTGVNKAFFYDTADNDVYSAYSDRAIMQGSGYYNVVYSFGYTAAYSTTGVDKAFLYDTSGNDTYSAWSNRAVLAGSGYFNDAYNFGYTVAMSTGGSDRAIFHGTEGDDTFSAWSNRAVLAGSGYFNDSRHFGYTVAYGNGGYDRAFLYGTADDDNYAAWADRAVLLGNGYFNDARDFDYTVAFGNGGNDRATFYDTAGDDTYAAWSNRAVMLGNGYFNDSRNFRRTYAYATEGNDRAIFHDSAGDDDVYALAWGAYITDGDYRNEARGFDSVTAYHELGGDDDATVDAIDYLFQLVGDWS